MKAPSYLSRASLIRLAGNLTEAAFAFLGAEGEHEPWSGPFGRVLVTTKSPVIGDLCYMREKFGWSYEQLSLAYGYTDPQDKSKCVTNNLGLHEFDGRWIIVIPYGHDGQAALGLGMDTACISIVGTDKELMTRLHACLVRFAEAHHRL